MTTLAEQISAHQAEARRIRGELLLVGPQLVRDLVERYGGLRGVGKATGVDVATLSMIRAGKRAMTIETGAKVVTAMESKHPGACPEPVAATSGPAS